MPRRKKFIVRAARDERPVDPRSTYKHEYVGIAARLAAQGMTDREIAGILGVTYRGFQKWLVTHPKLKEAMQIPKQIADARVEMALYQNAIGFDYQEEEVRVIEGEPVKVMVTRHQVGQTMAQLAWLHNRQRDHWRRDPHAGEVDELPASDQVEEVDITPENKRDIARRAALLLFQATKGTMQ